MRASGQSAPADEEVMGSVMIDLNYFTAQFNPEIRQYLALVNRRHASERVWKLYRAGLYNDPLGDCKYALERFPNHPRALNLLCEIAKATNQNELPIAYFEKALQLFPQYGYTHAQYGHYLVEIGAVNVGIAELREALQRDPGLIVAQIWLTQAQTKVKKATPTPKDTTRTGSGRGGEGTRN
jgi:predicted Zn-dependent protease